MRFSAPLFLSLCAGLVLTGPSSLPTDYIVSPEFMPPMKIPAIVACLLLLVGCQSSGAIALSADTYMISRTSAGGIFKDMASLKAQVIREANEFAESKGKVAVAMAMRETPSAPGRMPSFEYQFRLVEKNDPKAHGTVMEPGPDVIIEDRRAK